MIVFHVRAKNKPLIELCRQGGFDVGEIEYPAWCDWIGACRCSGASAGVAACMPSFVDCNSLLDDVVPLQHIEM